MHHRLAVGGDLQIDLDRVLPDDWPPQTAEGVFSITPGARIMQAPVGHRARTSQSSPGMEVVG